MTDKRIELRKLRETPTLGYVVNLLNPNEGTFPVYAVDVVAQTIDNHYILRTVHESGGTGQATPRIFGVSDTSEEADKRLYEKAKEIARDMAKGHQVRDLEDLTRHYQSLPRGGK